MSLPKSSAFRATRRNSKKNLSNAPFPLEVINSFGGYIRSSVAADHRGAEREGRDGAPDAPVRHHARGTGCVSVSLYGIPDHPETCRTATSDDCDPPGSASVVLRRTKIIADAAGQDRSEQ